MYTVLRICYVNRKVGCVYIYMQVFTCGNHTYGKRAWLEHGPR